MPSRALLAAALAFGLQAATAAPTYSLHWTDPAGDGTSVGDAVAVDLSFDAAGAWTATWWSAPGNAFHGNVRFNLNLFDTALGNLAAAHFPQLSLDASHDFGAGSATQFSYSGQAAFLTQWQVGDLVSTGNLTNFYSGLVDLDTPAHRDILLTQAPLTGTLPEPGTAALAVLALGLLARRRAKG